MRDGRFQIDPDPPIAGQPATITYTGPEDEVSWIVTGQAKVKAKVPPRTILIPRVPEGEELIVWDGSGGSESNKVWPVDATNAGQ